MPWVRAYYNPAEAGGMTSPLDGTQPTVEFTDSAPSGGAVVDGSSSCNTYSASYDDSGWLTRAPVTLTLMLLSIPVSQVGLLLPGWRLFCGQAL